MTPRTRALKPSCLILFVATLFVSGCAGFPTANPPEESFTQEELKVWESAEAAESAPLVGTWRLIDQRSSGQTELLWFQFSENGLFTSGTEDYFTKEGGKPRWQGAYRLADKTIVCQYQQKDGNDSWLKSRDGKGEVKRYPYYMKGKDTLVMRDVTRQKLTIKYHRAATNKK